MENEVIDNIYHILKKENRFLTLKEIYDKYISSFDVSQYQDYQSLIRRKINSRCLDRDLYEEGKEPLFFSLCPKKTRGNQYGLIEWNKDFIMSSLNDSISNNFVNRLPNNPVFDEVSLVEVDEVKKFSLVKSNLRSAVYVLQALNNANYMCEYENTHVSFIRKSNGKNYTEAHHLIPLSFQNEFKYSLDVPVNIISLCSNCHNQLHYGKDIVCILRKLYNSRIEDLKKFKIDCTFEELGRYYGVKDNE